MGGTGPRDDGLEGFQVLLGGQPDRIGLLRRGDARIDDEAQGLAGVVERDDPVDEHEVGQGRARRVFGWTRDRGLGAVDVFVADHADHATHEGR